MPRADDGIAHALADVLPTASDAYPAVGATRDLLAGDARHAVCARPCAAAGRVLVRGGHDDVF